MHYDAKLHVGLVLLFALSLTGCAGRAGQATQAVISIPAVFQLTVSTSGAGTITSSPAGINCNPTCAGSFNDGTTVTLTATANPGNAFAGWSGGCSGSSRTCTVVVNRAISVSASFNGPGGGGPPPVALSVSELNPGNGIVTSNPPGISCGQTCTASFPPGTTVVLTATSNPGFVFEGWSGACSGTGTCSVTLNAAGTVTASFNPTPTGTIQSVNHIIVLLQENRSFDQYFGHLNQYRQAHGLPTDVDDEPADASNPNATRTGTVQAFHMKTVCEENLDAGWDASHRDWNRLNPTSPTPTMDGFVFNATIATIDKAGVRAMGYYNETDLPYYYFMASQFATSDRWFSPEISRTDPNRLYIFAATSAGHAFPETATLSNTTIFHLLEERGISWKIYTIGTTTYFSKFQPFATEHAANIVSISQYFSDLANESLPAVALIESTGWEDEHPGHGSLQVGAAYVSTLINKLMHSTSWRDSVFILTYDEFGGNYDHVPPIPAVNPDGLGPIDLSGPRPGSGADVCWQSTGVDSSDLCQFKYTGFRVPFIVVSPFTKPHYVSHTPADYTAVLKFIETRYSLSSLTHRDAAQMDMTEFFDFADAPWLTPPASIPAQPQNGLCDPSQLQ